MQSTPKILIPRPRLKRSERPLPERQSVEPSEGQYRALFDRYPHPAWVIDRATLRFLVANEAAIARYGYSREDFLAMQYTDIHPPEDVAEIRTKLGQYAPSRGSSHARQKVKSGSIIRVHLLWRPVPFNRVPAILMIAEPPPRSVRRLLQETEEGRQRLEALSRRLVELQEMERSEIARELHDEIGQLLTGLKLMLASSVARDTRENGKSGTAGLQAADHQEMAAIVNELIGRLRDLSMNLRPPMLDQIGLVPTLLWHFERYTARTKIHVSFEESIRASRFPDDVEIAAFRIIQEALMNVARHAAVEEAHVQVEADRESLTLRIEDKGQGFNPRTAISGRSAGIIGMQERAHLVGGSLALESEIAGGTRITVVLPLQNNEEWGGESK
jgi:PAS domain S-box-containing protein